MFSDMLKTQLVLKGVLSPKEYEQAKEHITFDFLYDNHFSELKDLEILQNKLQAVQMCEPYVGKYFSVYEMRHKILGMTDGEIAETDKQIAYERNVGIIPAPPEEAPPEEGMEGEAPPEEGMEGEAPPEEGGFPEGDLDLSGDPDTDISALMKGVK
jgi:hypothetical protein